MYWIIQECYNTYFPCKAYLFHLVNENGKET